MLKAALTGGIATGKSYVLEQFRRLGAATLDADALAHGVTAAGTEATALIAQRFGADVLAADGAVNRKQLGPLVFADDRARKDLEAIVHPAVYRAIQAGIRAFERAGDTPVLIIDIPLLYETGRQAEFDTIVCTVCPPAVQIQRLRERGLSEEAAQQRLAAQMPAEEKAARAAHVIRTDGSFQDTDRQVQSVWEGLMRDARPT